MTFKGHNALWYANRIVAKLWWYHQIGWWRLPICCQ